MSDSNKTDKRALAETAGNYKQNGLVGDTEKPTLLNKNPCNDLRLFSGRAELLDSSLQKRPA
jgi:hypothetical protein